MRAKQAWRIGLAAAVLVLGLAAWQGAALAGSGPSKSVATASNYEGKGDCGDTNTAFPVVGKTTFERAGNKMTLTLKENALPPNTLFHVLLYSAAGPGACISNVDVGTMRSDKHGQAKGTFKAKVSSDVVWFFSDVVSEEAEFGADTVSVYLP